MYHRRLFDRVIPYMGWVKSQMFRQFLTGMNQENSELEIGIFCEFKICFV